jgi:hypothetical protein
MVFILAAAAVSCKAREADVGQPAQTNLSKQENLKYVLETASQDYNKQLPKEIDINMRLEKITVEPDNLLTFHITEISRPSSAINKDTFRTSMTPRIRKDVCEKVNGKPFPFMKDGASIAYSYSGKDGNEITTIIITPDDCGVRTE